LSICLKIKYGLLFIFSRPFLHLFCGIAYIVIFLNTYFDMALKSTIYKIDLNIADMDRQYYAQHNLTLAKHPSETDERVMVRLIAFTLFANESLTFGKGLSDDEEPDLWQKDLTGAIQLWIDVGLPTEKDIRKACGKSAQVAVVLYGGRIADMWWQQNSKGLLKLNNLSVINLPETANLAQLAAKSINISCTVQDSEVLLSHDSGSFNITPMILKCEPKRTI
jgi:uncharacterized protein YaeQ